MRTLVIAEQQNGKLTNQTLSTINAAQKIGAEITLLLVGSNIKQALEDAKKITAIAHIIYNDNTIFDHYIAENMANLVILIAKNYTHILANATTDGKNYMPRIAALLDVEQLSEVSEIISPDTFKRPIYAGNILATVQSSAPYKVLTIRAANFNSALELSGSATTEELRLDDFTPFKKTTWITNKIEESDRPDLNNAEVVISGGRALKSKENFQLIYDLADKLNAAVGGSRAAVDSGFISNDLQVGQTGKIVAPSLYIAVGISGAIQHLAGMKESKTIIAINNDPEAPIFQVADYGFVGDLFEVLPQLINEL